MQNGEFLAKWYIFTGVCFIEISVCQEADNYILIALCLRYSKNIMVNFCPNGRGGTLDGLRSTKLGDMKASVQLTATYVPHKSAIT